MLQDILKHFRSSTPKFSNSQTSLCWGWTDRLFL